MCPCIFKSFHKTTGIYSFEVRFKNKHFNLFGATTCWITKGYIGSYVNLEYRLPNGRKVKYLDDDTTYLGNQLEPEFGGDRCFGVLASMDFILVATYGENGSDPELLVYKKR